MVAMDGLEGKDMVSLMEMEMEMRLGAKVWPRITRRLYLQFFCTEGAPGSFLTFDILPLLLIDY